MVVKDLEGLRKFFDLDLINFLSQRQDVTRVEAANRLQQLGFYLAINVEAQAEDPPHRFSPPPILDEVWHWWMEQAPMSYQMFCQKHFGRQVDHQPMPAQPRNGLEEIAQRLGLTLNPVYWYTGISDGDCG